MTDTAQRAETRTCARAMADFFAAVAAADRPAPSLSFDDYQSATRRTARYPGSGTGSSQALSYVILGLNGEAGEVAEKYKKVLRDDDAVITPATLLALLKELGDTQWYLARVADELNIALSRVAADNLTKADDRARRGVLSGSGDNR